VSFMLASIYEIPRH